MNYPMKPMAKALESRGRYGDSVLVHMNPAEVAGIAALSPTGKLTRNPDTGQPEAFLPMMAAGLGSWLGTAGLGSTLGGTFLGATLGNALAGGLGSALATTAVTGDLKRGLASGIMGAGLGTALGASGASAGQVPVEGVATDGLAEIATNVEQGLAAPSADAITDAATQGMSWGPTPDAAIGQSTTPDMLSGMTPAQGPTAIGAPEMRDTTFSERLTMPFQSGSGLGDNLMSKEAILPFAVGANQLAVYDREDYLEDEYEEGQRDREAQLSRARSSLQDAYRRAQPGVQTGPSPYRAQMSVNRYAEGGPVDLYGGVDPVTVQANMRGRQVNTPPPGYRHGIDPEFSFFSQAPNPVAATHPNHPSLGTNAPLNPQAPDYGWNPGQTTNRQLVESLRGTGQMNDDDYSWFQRLFAEDENSASGTNWLSQDRESLQSAFNTGGLEQQNIDRMTRLLGNVYPQTGPLSVNSSAPEPSTPSGDMSRMIMEGVLRRGRGFGGMGGFRGFAEGGPVTLNSGMAGPVNVAGGGIANVPTGMQAPQPSPEDIQMLAAVLLQGGENANAVVEMFVQKYGPEVFAQVRDMILQSAVPGAQTEGLIQGQGDGMSDDIMGMIGNQQPVATSSGEYIVPADVVSGLGDGSTEAGAAQLDGMMDRVRMARGGTTTQPPATSGIGMLPR